MGRLQGTCFATAYESFQGPEGLAIPDMVDGHRKLGHTKNMSHVQYSSLLPYLLISTAFYCPTSFFWSFLGVVHMGWHIRSEIAFKICLENDTCWGSVSENVFIDFPSIASASKNKTLRPPKPGLNLLSLAALTHLVVFMCSWSRPTPIGIVVESNNSADSFFTRLEFGVPLKLRVRKRPSFRWTLLCEISQISGTLCCWIVYLMNLLRHSPA